MGDIPLVECTFQDHMRGLGRGMGEVEEEGEVGEEEVVVVEGEQHSNCIRYQSNQVGTHKRDSHTQLPGHTCLDNRHL